jgi:hypothetical protein
MTHIVIVDPSPFLSTIAAVSATLVAIVGGLLVARFVTITSEQEGAQQLIEDAQERLTTARRRKKEASDRLHDWEVNNFFDRKVIRAICDGERDVPALREVAGSYSMLADEQLAEVVEKIASEYEAAKRLLQTSIASTPEDSELPEWNEFKRSSPIKPDTQWEEVWELAYKDLTRPPRPISPLLSSSYLITTPYIPTPPEYVKLREERRDAVQDDAQRTRTQVEDTEGEVARLQRARDAIVRPKGLGWGLVVLAYFTFVGVIIPLWLMSRGPTRLTVDLGEVAFWLFFTGLLALLGYMTALALRLSGWRRKPTAPQTNNSSSVTPSDGAQESDNR